jgi:hypothetical protein
MAMPAMDPRERVDVELVDPEDGSPGDPEV